MELADWLLQNEKVVLFINSLEYKVVTAKSTWTPYEMLKTIDKDRKWQDIKKKLEEVYSPIIMEVHTLPAT